jgi:hypothetical protein
VTSYKLVGDHPETLGAEAEIVSPGETVDLSADDLKDPHTKSLVDDEKLVKPAADDKQGAKEGGS